MNKLKKLLPSVVSAFFFIFILWGPEDLNAQEICIKQGEIRGLEIDSQTVVVEVPLGSRLYTVGGEISSDTALKKGEMKKALLRDFRVGDIVRVGWKKTETRHKIEFLELIAPAAAS